jgi:rubrerythrin
MPTGPSHSSHSGGGGGSHGGFGGGGSHGGGFGGHVGGFGGGPAPRRPRGPIAFNWFGRPVVISPGKQGYLVAFIVLFIFMLIVSVSTFSAYGSQSYERNIYASSIQTIETDAVFYQNMLNKADADDPDVKKTYATFERKFYNYYTDDDFSNTGIYYYGTVAGTNYYFIVYEYTNEFTGQKAKGETYAQFSSSTASSLYGRIHIAYTFSQEDNAYVSMNTSYSLSENQEYIDLRSKVIDIDESINVILFIAVVSLILVVGSIVGFVFVIKKINKESKEQAAADEAKTQAEIAEARANAERATAEANSKNRVCAYCGSNVPDGADKCPSCGSRKFLKK